MMFILHFSFNSAILLDFFFHMCVCVCVCVHTCSVIQLCLTLRPYGLQPSRLLCPWDFPNKHTGAGCHFLLQEILLTQRSNLGLLHWWAIYLSIYLYPEICKSIYVCVCVYTNYVYIHTIIQIIYDNFSYIYMCVCVSLYIFISIQSKL